LRQAKGAAENFKEIFRRPFRLSSFCFLTFYCIISLMQSSLKILSHSPVQTQKIAQILVKTLLDQKSSPPHIFALQGNLGAGKTTFIQGVGKSLKIKGRILSPTFLIIKSFSLRKNPHFKNFYHIDCYRLEKAEEILTLDFKKIIQDPKNLVFIEWPERIKKLLPKNTLWINFKVVDKNKREITINSKVENSKIKSQPKTKKLK